MTKIFNKLSDLVRNLKKYEKKTGKQYYYRGQIHCWPIQSSASRVNYSSKEMEKTQFFVEKLKENKTLNLQNDEYLNKCLAIAQHYGYKTDFIDFTTDIEVAAFFATDGIEKNTEYKNGYLWRISSEEIELIKSIVRVAVRRLEKSNKLTEFQEENLKILKAADYNPFFDFSIPELSRMNNQKGVFLWDLLNIVTHYYFKDREADFEFKHNGQVYSSNTINTEVIYPQPNVLESEIERFKSVEAMKDFKETDLFKEANKLIIKDYTSITSCYLSDNQWPCDFGKSSGVFERAIKENIVKKINLKNDEKNIINIIKENRNNIENGRKISVDIGEAKLNCVINEAIDTLVYLPYTELEIKEVVKNIIEYDSLDLSELLHIGMKDSMGVESYGYVPLDIIDEIMEHKREQIKLSADKNLSKELQLILDKKYTWNLFLDLSRHPKKVFEFSEIKSIFIQFILPYQFLYRPKEYRIYVPTFLEIFGPE